MEKLENEVKEKKNRMNKRSRDENSKITSATKMLIFTHHLSIILKNSHFLSFGC